MRLTLTLTIGLALHAVANAGDDPADVRPEESVAERIIARTNASRREQQLDELKVSPQLTRAAQRLADRMAADQQLSHTADGHTPAQRIEAEQYRWTFVAENIAFRTVSEGQSADETAAALMQQWWKSDGHRRNLLDRRGRHIGVATTSAAGGAVYAVQVFAAPRDE